MVPKICANKNQAAALAPGKQRAKIEEIKKCNGQKRAAPAKIHTDISPPPEKGKKEK